MENRKQIKNIHNIRFYNLTPKPINHLAYNKNNSKLAVSRGESVIEIWDIKYAPILEKVIPCGDDIIVEALGWYNNRLFSTGLDGKAIEWNMKKLCKKFEQIITGNSAWCLDIHEKSTLLVIGTEIGYLNLFEINENDFMYKNLFDKQEGRIICCKFNESGEFIVTGSMDTIRVWNTNTGQAIHKMTLGRSDTKKETIVWCLQVLKDFTIIAGDSRGQLTVWDGKIGVQTESYQALKADILAISLNDEQNMLFCAGIDPIIRIYSLTEIKKTDSIVNKWIKFWQRSVHNHDVKALVCANNLIISGGIDGYLGISYYKKDQKNISKYGPFLQEPIASVAYENRCILLRYENYLELWKLGQVNESSNIDENSKYLPLDKGPEKLLELKSINEDYIHFSIISPNGKWLVYSTQNSIRLFSIIQNEIEGPIKLLRIKNLPKNFSPSFKILFSYDSKTITLIKLENIIDTFEIDTNGNVEHLDTIDTSRYLKDFIHLAIISECGNYLVLAGTCKTIAVWKKINFLWKHLLNLPKYIAPCSAIAIRKNLPSIVATFTDGKIFEYDLDEMKFLFSTNQQFLPNSYTHCINNILFDNHYENIILLHNDSYLFVLNKNDNIMDNDIENDVPASKITKIENKIEKSNGPNLKFHKSYEHFVHFDWLSENELVVVGVNPVTLIEQLPPSLKQKKFGAT